MSEKNCNDCNFIFSNIVSFNIHLKNYKNNINISVDNNRVSINVGDITTVKKPIKRSNVLYSEDNYVEMCLHKGLGFTINYGYKVRSNYKDEKLFDDFDITDFIDINCKVKSIRIDSKIKEEMGDGEHYDTQQRAHISFRNRVNQKGSNQTRFIRRTTGRRLFLDSGSQSDT